MFFYIVLYILIIPPPPPVYFSPPFTLPPPSVYLTTHRLPPASLAPTRSPPPFTPCRLNTGAGLFIGWLVNFGEGVSDWQPPVNRPLGKKT